MHRVLLVVALAFTACGVPDPTESSRAAITGGTAESGYLAVFALAYNGEGGCTGTCITPRIGLTAQHCIEGETAQVLSGLFGADEFQPVRTIQVTAIGTGPAGTDIAAVAFAEDCPATIPFNQQPLEAHVGEPVVMVGFGVTTETANNAGIKRSGTATLFSVDPAQVAGMAAGELATSNSPAGTCNGDSGGPTFMTFGGVEYVVGTTSRGSLKPQGGEYPCGQGRSIAVRTDSYASFINAFIAQHQPALADAGAPPVVDAGVPDSGAPDAGAMGGGGGDSSGAGGGGGGSQGIPTEPLKGCGCGASGTEVAFALALLLAARLTAR